MVTPLSYIYIYIQRMYTALQFLIFRPSFSDTFQQKHIGYVPFLQPTQAGLVTDTMNWVGERLFQSIQ